MKPVNLVHMDPSTAGAVAKKNKTIRLHETDDIGEYYVSAFSLESLRRNRVKHEILQTWQEDKIPAKIDYPCHSYLFDPPSHEAKQEVLAYALSQKKGKKPVQILYRGRRKEPYDQAFIMDRPGGNRSYQWEIPDHPRKVKDFRDLFKKIAGRIKDPDTKVLLSLGSGGIRLFAHPSIMKFIDLLDLRPHVDEIWGSSGGAIAGLPYSVGVEPEVIEQEGYHLYSERYSFRFSPSKLDVIKNLISDSFLPANDNMLQGFIDCQAHLEEMLRKHLGDHKDKIPFFCISYNLKERRNEVLTPEKIDADNYLIPIVQTDPLDAVIASSSIPILYVPKKIRRGKVVHSYIDGGTTEEVPLLSPYRKWKRDRNQKWEKRKKLLVLSVNLFPQVGSSKLFTHWIFKKIPAFRLLQLSATYADLVRQARIDEHKDYLSRDPDVTHWELTLPLAGTSIVNTKVIPKVIESAQHSFFEQLIEIEGKL